MVQEGFPGEVTSEQTWMQWGTRHRCREKTFQAERTRAKTLRREWGWCVQQPSQGPGRLELEEPGERGGRWGQNSRRDQIMSGLGPTVHYHLWLDYFFHLKIYQRLSHRLVNVILQHHLNNCIEFHRMIILCQLFTILKIKVFHSFLLWLMLR